MFALTRPHRQAIATLALFVLTVVPTVLIAWAAWRINRPGHVRDVEIELSRQLGLQVSLDSVHYPRPGAIVYRGIVVRQEEPRGRILAEIIRAGEVRLERSDRELTLHMVNPRLRGESPRLAMAQIAALLQRTGRAPFDRVNVSASSAELDLGQENLRFVVRDLAGEFAVVPAVPTIQLAFRIPGNGTGTRCELSLGRDRHAEPFVTTLTLQTVEGTPLPVRVLDVFFDAGSWFGADATLEGTLSLRQSGSKDWEADFHGSFNDVDLGTVIGRRFPRHRLAGRSRLAITTARWGERPTHGAGWIEVKGELAASHGTIGVSLLEALAREMKFRVSPRLANLDPRKIELDYRALGLSFAMQPNGEIRVAGALGAEFPADAILAGATTSLLSAPRGSASVHGLIKTLFPESVSDPAVMVPLTAESQVLLSLPVSPGTAPRSKQTLDAN